MTLCARQEGAAGTNLLLFDCGDECLAVGIGLYGCSEEGAVVVGNRFDSRYSADEVRLDCCWRNPNLRMGFPAGWLRTIFLWNCLRIGLEVSSCVVDADDLGRCQKTLVEDSRAALCWKMLLVLVFDTYLNDQLQVATDCDCCLTFSLFLLVVVE